jgi:hypothetical protein
MSEEGNRQTCACGRLGAFPWVLPSHVQRSARYRLEHPAEYAGSSSSPTRAVREETEERSDGKKMSGKKMALFRRGKCGQCFVPEGRDDTSLAFQRQEPDPIHFESRRDG